MQNCWGIINGRIEMSWYRAHERHGTRPVFFGGAAVGVLLVVAILAMVVIPSGAAGSANKTLNCTTVEPNPLAATGSSVTFTLHLCNDATSPNQLGSAAITAPTGFVITSVTPPIGASWNQTTNVLTNLAIAPGSTKNVTIQATTPSLCADPGNLQWAIDARQSNDFNGNPGNKFSPDPKYVHQSVTGSCKLSFVNQPAETAATTPVRTTIWGSIQSPSTGSAIQVEVLSGSTHVSSPSGTVTVTATGTGCAVAGGGSAISFGSNGYATFTILTLSNVAASTNCQLTATSSAGYAASDPSSAFNVDPVRLYFATQPKDAVVNTVLRDVKYGGTASPPSGNPIEVGVRADDGTHVQPFNGTGSVTMTVSGTGCAFTNSTTAASFDSTGVASFSNLKMQNAPVTGCTLTAGGSSAGYGSSGPSDSFNVDQNGTICSGSCDTGPLPSGDGNTTDVQVNNFTGTITVNFTPPTSLPSSVLAACGSAFSSSPGAGTATGDVVLDPTDLSGGAPNATVILNVAKKYLPRPPSQGNPFVPICAGARRVSLADETVQPCDTDPFGVGWQTQSYLPATCVTTDGFGHNFWGVLGNYTQQPPIAAQDPKITQWQGNPNDGSRTFWISLGTVQLGQNWYWDWKMQPA
jgi:hypothetical protein